MFSKRYLIPSILLVLCVAIAIPLLMSRKLPFAVRAFEGGLTPEDKEQIEAVIQKQFDLEGEARVNGGDVSRFPEVFVNTKDYPLSEEQLKFIADVLGADAAKDAGLLTAMQAYYKTLGEGNILIKNAYDKAKRENRPLTREEVQDIKKQNHGVFPPIPVEGPLPKVEFTIETIELTPDEKAVVHTYDGSNYVEYLLLKVNGEWFITHITNLRSDV